MPRFARAARALPRLVALIALLPRLAVSLFGDGGGYSDPCESGEATPFPGHHNVWGEVLAESVAEGTLAGIRSNLVDYSGLRASPGKLRRYLASLCNVDVDSMSADDKLALWLNAYNSVMLMMVVHFDPSQSVKQISSMVDEDELWYHKFATVGGMKVSLDDIEHKHIRGRDWGWKGAAAKVSPRAEGRVHACMVCGALSCPDLMAVPYEGAKIQEQLDSQSSGWLANPTKNAGPSNGRLAINMVFNWFRQDFERESGTLHSFLATHAPASWDVDGSEPIDFMEYNWALNWRDGTGEYVPEQWYDKVWVQVLLASGGFLLLCVLPAAIYCCCCGKRRCTVSVRAGKDMSWAGGRADAGGP